MIRSTPNDHPTCFACRIGILPGHRHIPIPVELRLMAAEQGQDWPSFSIPSDWKVKRVR